MERGEENNRQEDERAGKRGGKLNITGECTRVDKIDRQSFSVYKYVHDMYQPLYSRFHVPSICACMYT